MDIKRIIKRLKSNEDFKSLFEKAEFNDYSNRIEIDGERLTELDALLYYIVEYEQKADAIDDIVKRSELYKSDIVQALYDNGELKKEKIKKAIQRRKRRFKKLDEFKVLTREEYESVYCVNSLIDDFLEENLKRINTEYIKTSIYKLDEALGGGLSEGLYIIGAISSLGKTTLALQIADNIAEQERDVLFISLEMSKYELMSKSISRITRELCENVSIAKTSRDITDVSRYKHYSKQEKELIKKAVSRYRDVISHNMYIAEGVGNVTADRIRYLIDKHRELTGRTPLLFIDYLQIIEASDTRATDKQNIDRAVTELKRISRDYKTTVFAISSFNRDSYSNAVTMASFKESGAVEYSSDVLLALQPCGMQHGNDTRTKKENAERVETCKKSIQREVELVILKNRNGRTGGKIALEYDPRFNYFIEQEKKEAEKHNPFFKRKGV